MQNILLTAFRTHMVNWFIFLIVSYVNIIMHFPPAAHSKRWRKVGAQGYWQVGMNICDNNPQNQQSTCG